MEDLAYFVKLPFDLHFRIFEDLEPYDLFRLSQICRCFCDAVSQREVWRVALKTTCAKHGLFEPSFPVESMTTDELRRSAMGPMRWYRKMFRLTEEKRTLEPISDRLVQSGYFIHPLETDPTGQFHIVPGGRYILGHSSLRIELWDAGYPFTQPLQAPICKIDSMRSETLLFLGVSGPVIERSNRLRFLLTARTESNDIKLQVYEVGPLPTNSCIRILKELVVERSLSPYADIAAQALCGRNRIAFWFGGTDVLASCIVIWDSAQSLIGSIACGRQVKSAGSQIIIEEDVVVVFTEYCVAGWPMPSLNAMAAPLSLITSLHASPPVRAVPAFLFEFQPPTQNPMDLGKKAISLPLLYQQPGPLVFDRMWSVERSESRGAHVQLERYQLDLPTHEDSARLKLLSSWRFVQRHYQQRLSLSSEAFPNLMPSSSIASMKPVFRPDLDRRYLDLAFIVSATGEVAKEVMWMILNWSDTLDPEPLHWNFASQYTLPCIASGRIACLGRQRNEVRLLDF